MTETTTAPAIAPATDDIIDRDLTRPDGRLVAWTESGVPDGRPVLRMPGTPGSRFSVRADRRPWIERNLRMITTERPGYGRSTRLPGRGFAEHADDLAAILDHLGIDRLPVMGGSGGAPHVLAFLARHPDRVMAASIIVGAAPVIEEEADQMIPINTASWRFAQAGDWDGLRRMLEPERDAFLADPLANFRDTMETAPEADQQIMGDPQWQDGFVRAILEALRPGVEGWTDEGFAIERDWADIDLGAIRHDITWWHGDGDRNSPLSAVRRLAAAVPGIHLRIWTDAGHLTSYRHEPEILDELLGRAGPGSS